MNRYIAAAVQLTSTPDLAANLATCVSWIAQAVAKNASLICLPENFSFLGPDRLRVRMAEEIARQSEAMLLREAARHQVWILGGGHAVPAPGGKTYNRAVLAGPDGLVAAYDKMHLFDVNLPEQAFRESELTAAGDTPVVADAGPCGHIGLSICYDLRFPELYRALAAHGAEILAVPAAFTAFTGRDHWLPLLQARAIENTCYLLAPAQCGTHFARRSTHGHTLILDPWGSVLADAGTSPGLAIAELNPAHLADVRRLIPSLLHRRL
jgi:predicted amidohydrolase